MSRSKTILFAWELGGGFGHIRDLLRVADALAELGHRPVLALRQVIAPWTMLRDRSWPILLAPHWVSPTPDPNFFAHSFADILGSSGHASIETLAPLVRQWEGLLDVVRPDLVVAHFAPTLILATAERVPVLDIGNGFSQPPCHLDAFPPLLPQAQTPTRFCEADLLQVVAQIQQQRGRSVPGTLPAAFAGVERCVTVIPELDPYRESRSESVVGSLEPAIAPVRPAPEPRFFAYLSANVTSTEPALTLLARAGIAGEAYLRDSDSAMRDRLRATGLIVHDRPVSLAEVLPRVRVIIHHAGLRLSEASLMAGRAQLLFPEHLEHLLSALALHRLGVAHYLAGTYRGGDVVEGMQQLLDDPGFANRAAAVAGRLVQEWPVDPLETVLGRCREILGDGG